MSIFLLVCGAVTLYYGAFLCAAKVIQNVVNLCKFGGWEYAFGAANWAIIPITVAAGITVLVRRSL